MDNDSFLIYTAAPENYAELLTRLHGLVWDGTVTQLHEAADLLGWKNETWDDNSAVFASGWPELAPWPWHAEFDGGNVRGITVPLSNVAKDNDESYVAIASLWIAAARQIDPILGDPHWCGTDGRLLRWAGKDGCLTLRHNGTQVFAEYSPYGQQEQWDAQRGITLYPFWPMLRDALTAEFGRWTIDDAVICTLPSGVFVQFISNSDDIHLEVNGPGDNDSGWLPTPLRAQLLDLGWQPPEETGWHTWICETPQPATPQVCATLAELIITTLRLFTEELTAATVDIRSFNTLGGEDFELGLTPTGLYWAQLCAQARHSNTAYTDVIGLAPPRSLCPGGEVIAVCHNPAPKRMTADQTAAVPTRDLIIHHPGHTPSIVVIGLIPPSGEPATRLVRDPHDPVGPYVRAEQGSTAYLLHLLRDNPQIAADLADSPYHRDAITEALAVGGPDLFGCYRAELHADETFTTARMRLDPGVLAALQNMPVTSGEVKL